ncbi:MAG: M20 family metallopeptidase [Chloroflexi bacterium]|nr:M20 family metallopeptidase [Chloroflexota bacterium]MCY3937545.1 M20 family metallopeptidase [Chloroflexota bacterium]
MFDPNELIALIDRDAVARDTLEFVRVESETGTEGPGSEFFAELLKREGLEPVLDHFEPDRPNVYAKLEGAEPEAGRSLMLNGHVDTVPIGVSEPPALDDEWVVGRGAEDMKGGLVAIAHAASAIKRSGLHLAGDLVISGVIGHETPIGQKEGPDRIIQLMQDGELAADAIVIAEGPKAIWAASAGCTGFKLTVTNPRGMIHNLYAPYDENPARWLGEALRAFETWEDEFRSAPPSPLTGREQVNVGILQAGDYVNRLPTPASVIGTHRWQPGTDEVDVQARYEALCADLADRSGLEVTVSFMGGGRAPFEIPASDPVIRALQTGSRQVLGREAEIIGMQLVGDASLFANEIPVPSVYFGPGHGTAHSDNERIRIDDLVDTARVYALAAVEYCGLVGG